MRYRNINRRALKKLLFFRLGGLSATHPDYKPLGLYPGVLKSGINFALEPERAYIWVGLYLRFYGIFVNQKKSEFYGPYFQTMAFLVTMIQHKNL